MTDPEFDRQANAADEMEHILSDLDDTTDWAEGAAALAAKFHLRDTAPGDPMMPVAEMVAQVQDVIRRLRKVELDLTAELGRHVREAKGERLGYLPDGRQWRLHRTAERKAWDHELWKHDARAKALEVTREGWLDPEATVAVADDQGEVWDLKVSALIQNAMLKLQEFHGSAAPRTGTLKAHDLDPGDYCEQVPGNWKLDAIEPNHDQED